MRAGSWRSVVGAVMAAIFGLACCSFALESGRDAERRAYAQKLSALLAKYAEVNASGQQSCLQGPTKLCGEAIRRYCAMLENFRSGLDQPPAPPKELAGQHSKIVGVLQDFVDTCPQALKAISNNSAPDLELAIAEFQIAHRSLNEYAEPIVPRLTPQDS